MNWDNVVDKFKKDDEERNKWQEKARAKEIGDDRVMEHRRSAKEQSIKSKDMGALLDRVTGTPHQPTLKDIFNNLHRVVTKVLEWQGKSSPGDNRIFQYCRLLKMDIEGRGALKKKKTKKKKTEKKKKKKKKTKKKKTKKKN